MITVHIANAGCRRFKTLKAAKRYASTFGDRFVIETKEIK